MNDATVSELEAKHGPILSLESEFGEAAFRVPTAVEWQRFIDELADAETRGRAARNLVVACRVHPSAEDFIALIGSRPGLVQAFGNQLTDFAGLKKVEIRKK